MLGRGEPPIEPPPPLVEAWEYTDEHGRRWRYVRVAAPESSPALPGPAEPATTVEEHRPPAWPWALALVLPAWCVWLLRPWRFDLWGGVGGAMQAAWVLSWIGSVLGLGSLLLTGLAHAFRR